MHLATLRPALLLTITSLFATASARPADEQLGTVLQEAQDLYLNLHQHPELSLHETNTAALLATRLRTLGYQVNENIGGTGLVGTLKNGAGPTVMLRTELDALPVEEQTGLPYASKVHAKDDSGRQVPVMHACGHDLHMAAWWGTASIMAKSKESWHGTLMLVAQPAEEVLAGAQNMVKDGLFTRFPKPDIAIALHDTSDIAAGQVGVATGYLFANADSIRITVYGKGGHGARPETTVDPVLIAANIAVRLQSVVAREVRPGDPAVITVGLIQAGTKNNIIPDQALMGLTVRSYTQEVRRHLLTAIERIAKAEAEASGAEKMPLVEKYESTSAVYNDVTLARHLSGALETTLGKQNVISILPGMGSEDFSAFTAQGVPSFFFRLGVAGPEQLTQAKSKGVVLPNIHSSLFAPVLTPSLKTAITAEVALLRDLLSQSPGDLRKITDSAEPK